MIDLRRLFNRIQAREFNLEDARELIKSSFYFAGTHPDVHIVLSTRRPLDYHFQHLPNYEERALHSMFDSLDDAAAAVAGALNCDAGMAAARFLGMTAVQRVALYSRSGAAAAGEMLTRAAIASMGVRTGTMYGRTRTLVVVAVLSIFNGQVVLTTAYPAQGLPANRPLPPDGMDTLEYGNQRFNYPMTQLP